MKKVFTKLGIILIASATILPLSACTFNFYINRVTNSIAKSFADQTSALLKSMVMSKELGADTSSTNDDIMGKIKNNSINNLTSNTSLNNWGDLQSHWGENNNIDVNGFNTDDFFTASGKGQLTKNINSKKNINNIFSSLSNIRVLSIIDNPELVNIVLNGGMSPISQFLKSLQGDLSHSSATLQLVANLIKDYDHNFLNPLTSVFNNLINGNWNDKQTTTPTDEKTLTEFMNNWKDDSGQPYSAWNNNGRWNIKPFLFPGHEVKKWNWQKDYDLYHGGALINYLFWKISKDHENDKDDEGNKIFDKLRYLGDILSEHITVTRDGLEPKINFYQDKFAADIKRYVPFLLTNPLYKLLMVEGIMPIIKKWILKMTNIAQGVKNLTIGKGYPTNPANGSYNLLDIANTIKFLFNDPIKIKQVLQLIFGKTTAANRGFDTFIYDIKLTVKVLVQVPLTLGGVIGDGKFDPDPLIDSLINGDFFNSIKSTINNIVDMIIKISQQYPDHDGINIDLQKLEIFLFDNTTGLLIILKNYTIGVLQNIINKDEITTTDVEELYQSLGGHTNSSDPGFPTFTPGSILDVLQKTMIIPNSELNHILNLIIGTTDEDHRGIKDIITDNNNQWIKDNYEIYFDADKTTGINKKIGNTYNISTNKNTNGNIETMNLKYDFTYKIKNNTYHFIVTAIDVENKTDFQGIRTFKFKSITRLTA